MADSLIPWINDTVLGQVGWRNGSLLAQSNSGNPPTDGPIGAAAYPNNFSNELLNLTIQPDNLIGLTFFVNHSSVAYNFPVAQLLFDQEYYGVPVTCIYPLSGQYDTLSRALFYLLLIISLLFRHHNWLATAALGVAMTYAATSALHMFILLGMYRFGVISPENGRTSARAFGDPDVYGIYPVLSAAAIMITPILNWSSSFRRSQAKAIVVYWSLFVFAALIPAWLYFNSVVQWFPDAQSSVALCPWSSASDQCGPSVPELGYDVSRYVACNCMDFCSTISPEAPLRTPSGTMVAWLGLSISSRVQYNNPEAAAAFNGVTKFNYFVIIFIVGYGLLGLLQSQLTQTEVRNLIFRVLYMEPRDFVILVFRGQRERNILKRFGMEQPSVKRSFRWRCQWHFARLMAAAWFIIAIVAAGLCPAVLVMTVVTNEINVGYYPVSEHSNAVGAWGTWTSVGFAILAGIISRYHEAWIKTLLVGFRALWWRFAYTTEERIERQADGPPLHSFRTRIEGTLAEIISPITHACHNMRVARWAFSYYVHLLVLWWRDPVGRSHLTRDQAEAEEAAARTAALLECNCRICERRRRSGDARVERRESTYGEMIFEGLEQRYAGNRGRDEDSKPFPLTTYSEPPQHFRLPPIQHAPTLFFEPGDHPDGTSETQQRHTFKRQGSLPSSPPAQQVKRKAVPPQRMSSQESQSLLEASSSYDAYRSPEITSGENFDEGGHSEPHVPSFSDIPFLTRDRSKSSYRPLSNP